MRRGEKEDKQQSVGKTNPEDEEGIMRVLNRLTYVSTLSHLRRVNSPIGREGQVCGLVKNLALVIYTRVGLNANSSLEILDEWGTRILSMLEVELDVDGMDKNSLLKLADASCADADVDASCADADAFCADANASLLLMLADAYTSCCSC
ncbi:DNA-directed RNA polymerase II subunit RPB2 [Tanacetum coccineum]